MNPYVATDDPTPCRKCQQRRRLRVQFQDCVYAMNVLVWCFVGVLSLVAVMAVISNATEDSKRPVRVIEIPK